MAPKTAENRTSVNYRLTSEGIKFIATLAAHWGISNTSVVELSIRLLAEKHGYHNIPESLMTEAEAESARKKKMTAQRKADANTPATHRKPKALK